MTLLESALEYKNKFGFSLIPFRNDKSAPYLKKWDEFQVRHPTDKEIISWWTKWPDAIIAGVTGKISNLMLIDFDTYKIRDTKKHSKEAIAKVVSGLIPFTVPGPAANTPNGGYHRQFSYLPGVGCLKSVELCVDIKGEGGLDFLPPSANGNGRSYSWQPGRSIQEQPLFAIDPALYNNIINAFSKYIEGPATVTKEGVPIVTERSVSYEEGNRDDSVYHAAWCLVRGGMEHGNLYKILKPLGDYCSPPLEERDVLKIIRSAIERANKKDVNVLAEVREFVERSEGYFSVTEAFQSVPNVTNRQSVRVALHRMVKDEKILERDPNRDGIFRKVNTDETEIDFKNAKGDFLQIAWPFQIEKYFNTAPKNIIIVAGESDAGKTAFLLNFAALNNNRSMRCYYFSSEMGEFEMRERLRGFAKPTIDGWRMKVFDRSSNFADVIRPDEINIIDFLEIHDEFYKVGLYIKQIFDKLNKGIAVIAIQKNPGKEQGLGGMRSIEKARLAINMERGGKLIIDKAKNWATMNNPRGLAVEYNLVGGCHFKVIKDWYYADGIRQLGEREAKQQQYQQPYTDQF